jgi:hypothetical protein
MALQPFVEPRPLFQFLDSFTQSVGLLGRGDQPFARPLHIHRINAHRHPCLSGIRTHDSSALTGEDGSCVRRRGNCDRRSSLSPIISSISFVLQLFLILLPRSSCSSYLLLSPSSHNLMLPFITLNYSTAYVRSCILLFLIFHLFLLQFLFLIPHVLILIHHSSYLVRFIRYISVSNWFYSSAYFSNLRFILIMFLLRLHGQYSAVSMLPFTDTAYKKQDLDFWLSWLTSLSGKQCSASRTQ